MSEFEREIEIKFKIDDDIASKLKSLKLKPYKEIDEYFFTNDNVDSNVFLRFRKKQEKIFLNLKLIVVGGKEGNIYEADEIETEITKGQYENIKRIFNIIFPIKMQIEKTRSISKINKCTLFYDKVKGLGDFLEIEGPKDEIKGICKKLNLTKDKRDKERGYAKMTLKKMGFI